MYAFPNTGVLYDVGFVLGFSAWDGGAAAGAARGESDTGESDTDNELTNAQYRIQRLRRKLRRLRHANALLQQRIDGEERGTAP